MGRGLITSVIRGGLGNQLFQYAAGRALALRRETDLGLDLGWYADTNRPYWLPYELDTVGISAAGTVATGPRCSDPHPRFDPRALGAPNGTVLDGYWQSERYFADAADQIHTDLRRVGGPRIDAIAVHVRRGTAAYPADPAYGMLSQDYYRAALDRLPRSLLALVFSDAPQWCQENLQLGRGFEVVTGGGSPAQVLSLMARCEHTIIANSSFSWWGAWLNPNPDKIVFAPTGFSGDEPEHFTPESWRKILDIG